MAGPGKGVDTPGRCASTTPNAATILVTLPLPADGGVHTSDDFAFTGDGDEVIAALNAPNAVVRIRPGRSWTTVLTSADGLQNPTSVALRGSTLYVLSAAYTTATDPHLLLTRIPRRF